MILGNFNNCAEFAFVLFYFCIALHEALHTTHLAKWNRSYPNDYTGCGKESIIPWYETLYHGMKALYHGMKALYHYFVRFKPTWNQKLTQCPLYQLYIIIIIEDEYAGYEKV